MQKIGIFLNDITVKFIYSLTVDSVLDRMVLKSA